MKGFRAVRKIRGFQAVRKIKGFRATREMRGFQTRRGIEGSTQAIGEKEENFVLVDRRKKEKSFHAVAKAKFHIQHRHDKVPTGSFPYSTRQNCNRVKTSIARQNSTHTTDTTEYKLLYSKEKCDSQNVS